MCPHDAKGSTDKYMGWDIKGIGCCTPGKAAFWPTPH
jgi:hypothetical protein